MPGISFLFKKRFHPARIDNQKKLFIVEQSAASLALREKEAAEEARKERELLDYETIAKKASAIPDGNSSWAGEILHFQYILFLFKILLSQYTSFNKIHAKLH